MSKTRKTILSVTNFIHFDDHYLFIKRNSSRKIDGGLLNGIGGKVDPGENFLEAAIRETREETGFVVTMRDISLAGVVNLRGGYEDDWAMCFFKIEVSSHDVPRGMENEEGKLFWIHKDSVLGSSHVLVDDLYYCFEDVVNGRQFFLSAELNNDEKIIDHSKTYLNLSLPTGTA